MAKGAKHISRDRKGASISKRDRQRNQRFMRVLGAFLLVVVAFVAGFLVRSQPLFVSSLGFTVAEEELGAQATGEVHSTLDSVGARVLEAEDLLEGSGMYGINLDAATPAMIEDLVSSTDDPYAAYYSPDRYASYVNEASTGSYAGIGVLLAEYNGRAYVADVFEGSEAESKNVMQGDVVVAIDGDAARTWSLAEALNAIDRGEGESVVITWMRPVSLDAETGEEFTTTLTCHDYEVTNVSTELDDTVGYIKIRQITQNSAQHVSEAVNSLTAQGATSFVLDLRDNPGGYLTQAVDIAAMFVKSGVIVEIETSDGRTTKNATGVTLTEAPVVVMVNGYTSSAAEVLAAGLQGNGRAEVVGVRTVGKGSVQVMRELSFGGAIRYTAAYYYTPLGADIDGAGVIPDLGVSDADSQKRIAIDTARSLS